MLKLLSLYSARMQGLWMRGDLRGLCIGAACGAALHKPFVIASCEQRAGHTREQLPCPVCDWAVSMSDNGRWFMPVQPLDKFNEHTALRSLAV
jgi:hypothetical protein